MLKRSVFRFRFGVPLALAIICGGNLLAATPILFDSRQPAVAQIRLLSESPRGIELEFLLGRLYVDTLHAADAMWISVHAEGMGAASQAGWPEAPQQSVWLRLTGANPRVTIIESDTVRRNWGALQPAPEPLYRSESGELRRIPAAAFYAGNSVYPAQPAAITVSGDLSTTPLALLTFTPVQVHPRTGEYMIYTRLRVRVEIRRGALDRPAALPPASREIVNRSVLNPPPDVPPLTVSTPRILLVTEPQFLPALEPYIQWKRQSGLPVQIIIFSQIAQNAPALRAYLHEICRATNPAPEYILLVGDVDVIPPFFGVGSSLTDHPYSLLNEGDYLPDIAVGRIPSPDVSDCSDWVERLLSYERDAAFTGNFAGTVFSSNVARDPQHGSTVSALFQARGMAVDRLQQPETGSLSLLMSSLNAGRQWVFYIGHGYAQGWSSVTPHFTNSQVNTLNAVVPSIVVAVACATADLDFPGGSIAEHWLARPDMRGPLAYFGATENTPFFRSDTLALGALRAIFEQNCERLGTAADLGRLATAQSFPQPPGGLTEETIQQFVLLGDPSMRVFNTVPQPLNVVFPAHVPLGTPTIQISVLRGSQPLAGADVSLTASAPDFFHVGRTNAAGTAVLPLDLLSPAAIQLTVCGRNAIPFLGEIQVIPAGGAFIRTGPLRIVDLEGDGVPDRGEFLQMQFALRNTGNAPTSAGSVRIIAADSLLEFAPHAAAFAPIAAGDTLWLSPPLAATVSMTAPDLAVARLNVTVIAGDTTRSVETLTIRAPVLAYRGCSIREDSGDGDGNPEAGERLLLNLSFENTGGDHAAAVACSLLSLPPQVALRTTRVEAAAAAPGAFISAEFTLQAAAGLPRGFPLEFGYRLSGTYVDGPSGWDRVRIGQMPVFLYVLDMMPQQVSGIENALAGLGVEYERGTLLPPDLSAYASLWIFCGIYPNAVALSANDANRIRQYLNDGGRCYWEGGDVWAFDPQTGLHPYFRIAGLHDGTSDAGPIDGEYGTAFAHYRFGYAGENSFIDQLAPQETAFTILRNGRAGRTYPVCIAYAGTVYRTIGASIEIGALADSLYPSLRITLVRDMLTWFGIDSRADIFPPTIEHVPVTEVNSPRAVSIFADLQDAAGIEQASVQWRINGGPQQSTPLLPANGGYQGELPGASFGSTITYRLQAVDRSPLRNAAATPEYRYVVVARPDRPLRVDFSEAARTQIAPRIVADSACAWTLTPYPDLNTGMLELQGSAGQTAAYVTAPFDASRLAAPVLAFHHYLRDPGGRSNPCARITASTDGGLTFSHNVWATSAERRGILEEGIVVVNDLRWMTGQTNVVLRFEFSGAWYWRIGEITVLGGTTPLAKPVQDLVIWVRREGIGLDWKPVPNALHYDVLAAPTADDDAIYESIGQTADTFFVDRDDIPLSRFYMVRAIIEDSRPAGQDVTAGISTVPAAALLRAADLRWNAKLEALRRP